MQYISVVHFTKFIVKIVLVYILVKHWCIYWCFNTRLSEQKLDLKPINLIKLKKDDLNKKNCIDQTLF